MVKHTGRYFPQIQGEISTENGLLEYGKIPPVLIFGNSSVTPLQLNIKEFCDANKSSFRSLSLKAGLNEKAIQNIMSGKSKHPRTDTIAKIANVIGVSLNNIALSPTDHGADGGRPQTASGSLNEEAMKSSMLQMLKMNHNARDRFDDEHLVDLIIRFYKQSIKKPSEDREVIGQTIYDMEADRDPASMRKS